MASSPSNPALASGTVDSFSSLSSVDRVNLDDMSPPLESNLNSPSPTRLSFEGPSPSVDRVNLNDIPLPLESIPNSPTLPSIEAPGLASVEPSLVPCFWSIDGNYVLARIGTPLARASAPPLLGQVNLHDLPPLESTPNSPSTTPTDDYTPARILVPYDLACQYSPRSRARHT